MLKIRRSRDRLIFYMGIPILVRRHLYIETALRLLRVFMVVAWHSEVLNPHHHLGSRNGRGLFLSTQVTVWLGYRYSSWKAPHHMKRHKWRSYFGQPDFSLYAYIMLWPLLIKKKTLEIGSIYSSTFLASCGLIMVPMCYVFCVHDVVYSFSRNRELTEYHQGGPL